MDYTKFPKPQNDGKADHLINKLLPDISLKNQQGNLLKINRSDTFRLILYFYPMTGNPNESLPKNWNQTPLGKRYDIYKDEENSGQQFPTDTGPIDILAISKDKKEVLVVELKKGRASDSVVGQIQRYMGYVTEFVAEDNQQVKGVIIALDEDQRIKFALKVAPNIKFYRYEIKFDLIKE